MWAILSSIISGIIGPITNTITAIYTKKQDAAIAIDTNDATVIAARNNLLGQIHKDPAIAVGWYMFIVPTGLWFGAIVAYCLIHPWFPWYATVLALPPNIQYIPYAVVTFLFGLAWRGKL